MKIFKSSRVQKFKSLKVQEFKSSNSYGLTVLRSYALTVFFLFLFSPTNTFAQTDFFYSANGEKECFKIRKDRVILKCRTDTNIDAFLEQSCFTSAQHFANNYIIASIDSIVTNISHLKQNRDITDVTYALEYTDGTLQMPTCEIFFRMKGDIKPETVLNYTGLEDNMDYITLFNPHHNIYLMNLNVPLENVLRICRNIYETGWCEFVVPSFFREIKLSGMNRDGETFYPKQWALNNTGDQEICPDAVQGMDIKAELAWRITKGSPDIIVAVLDEGIQLDHPDLAANIVDGYDATGKGSHGAPNEGNPHGTQCAGIIAALDNNTGIIGVAPNCKIVSVRIGYTKKSRGDVTPNPVEKWEVYDTWVVRGLRYAWDTAKVDVISCSWGVTGSAFPQTVAEIEDAVTFGREGKGCVIVASAGGNTQDEAIYFPASSPNALSVGAITCKGWRAGFSCYGPALDVMAPGADIYTTYLGGGCNDWFSGSSASCPHVAGIAVLILSVNKCLKHDEVRKIIELSCEKVHRDSIYNYTYSSYHKNGTWNNEMGHGLVNAYKALLYAMASPHDTTVSGYTYNVSEILDWTYESNSFCDNYNFQEGTHKVKRYEIRATVQYDYTISPVIQGIANGFSDNTQLNRGCYFMDIVSYSETEATVRTYVYEKINPATGATLGWIPTHPDEVRFNVHVTCDNLQYELLLQNHTETGTKTYNVITGIAAGKNVNSNEPVGNYTIISRANVSMHAGETILLADGFTASAGSFFHAYIEPFFTCTFNTTTRVRGRDNEYVYVIKDYSVEKSDVQNLETEALGNELYLKLYPNPSTGNVTVEYNLNSSAVVEITLHDNSGKPVYTLKNRTPHDAGVYKITLSGVELPAGIYYCTLKTEKEQKTEKLMIVR